jgi:hypothetical protein
MLTDSSCLRVPELCNHETGKMLLSEYRHAQDPLQATSPLHLSTYMQSSLR